MSEPKQPKLELQLSSPQALVRRMDQQLALVARLLAEADAAHALRQMSGIFFGIFFLFRGIFSAAPKA
jgi:hypothetical protein